MSIPENIVLSRPNVKQEIFHTNPWQTKKLNFSDGVAKCQFGREDLSRESEALSRLSSAAELKFDNICSASKW
jgi:hypothetical protein